MIEIQTDFQRQVIILKKELEDEKQARIKLEAEVKNFNSTSGLSNYIFVHLQVRTLKKLVNK